MPHPHPHQLTAFSPDVTPTPRIVFWETTGACNLRCVHCRREWSDAPPNELSTDEVKHLLIDAIADARWHSILVFSGGEPLMRHDLYELIAYTAKRGLIPAVATNATLVDDDVARKFKDLGVSRVSVSLDGASAPSHDAFRGLPGSFDDALRGIRALRNAGVEVQVNVTFTKANRDDAPAMLDLVQKLDACALHVFLLVPVGCGVELPDDVRLEAAEVERLLTYFDEQATERDFEIRATCAPQAQRIRRQRMRARERKGLPPGRGLAPSSKGCLAGGGILFVDAIGKVFPCGYLPLQAGDLRKTPLATILAESELLSSLRDPSKLEGRCQGCEFDQSCGGCRARSFGTTGNLFGEEPSCPMNMAR
jgi:radical SAM protein with 4Fe4S-binding SPASM domain